jgi:hypothetical protein
MHQVTPATHSCAAHKRVENAHARNATGTHASARLVVNIVIVIVDVGCRRRAVVLASTIALRVVVGSSVSGVRVVVTAIVDVVVVVVHATSFRFGRALLPRTL